MVDLGIEAVELPDGERLQLEVVRHAGGAAVVAINAEGRVCLLRQYRHAAGGWIWELPAGRLEPDESPLDTAQRELREEAGLQAERWQPLGTMISTPGFCDEVIHVFLARELALVTRATERHELIEVHWLPFADAVAWARSGAITDAKTVVGLFRAQALQAEP